MTAPDLPQREPDGAWWQRPMRCSCCGRPNERFRTPKMRRVFVVCPRCDLVRGNVPTLEYM